MKFPTFITQTLRGALGRAGYQLNRQGSIPLDVRRMRLLTCLSDLYRRIEGVEGSVVECGVGKGRTFLMFSFLIQEEGAGRVLWGFDSFEGFPEPTQEDDSARKPLAGEWSGISPDDIRNTLRTGGISKEVVERAKLIPGFFEKTTGRYDGKPIAFLHVDADLYDSYKTVLAFFVPVVAKGGIVLFDEYGEEKWPGATKAVDEFLRGTTWVLEKHPSGKFFFVKT